MILPAGYKFTAREWPWKNFKPEELACRHCGEIYYWPEFMDALQALRERAGRPIRLLSGHRCALHNARVGGAPLSQHLRLAVDVSLIGVEVSLLGHDRQELAKQARAQGFTGLGYYQNFLHLDMGRKRYWFGGDEAKKLWV